MQVKTQVKTQVICLFFILNKFIGFYFIDNILKKNYN